MPDERPDGLDCCVGLLDIQGRVTTLEAWRLDHEEQQRKTTERLFERLDLALKRPPEWVTAVIGVLMCMVGALGGALGMALAK